LSGSRRGPGLEQGAFPDAAGLIRRMGSYARFSTGQERHLAIVWTSNSFRTYQVG
jgi:hypothetical protein